MPDHTARDRPPFVLLHGGRHGGWCWQTITPRLRAAGHEVHTPTLTGLGERSHLLHPGIGLSDHVADLVAVFRYEEIDDAVLVAHSYGGVVASGAMQEIADQVRLVVLVDGLMARSNESVFDMIGPERARRMVEMAEREGDGWRLPTSDAAWWGVTDPVQAAWVNARTSPQPLATYRERTGDTERMWRHPGAFVECSRSTLEPHMLARGRERADADPTFTHHVIDAGHDAMVTSPEALAGLLLDLATAPATASA